MKPKVKPDANASKYRIALVLQGGGALGAYQAGVFQAMHEHELAPDWIVGTSIGAINACLIAGNEPSVRVDRIKTFWDRVSHGDSVDLRQVPDMVRRFNSWFATLNATTRGVPGFFSPRIPNLFAMGLGVAPETASFYDSSDLRATLEELVDFDYLNAPGGTRLTVNAVKVTDGTLISFDNSRLRLGPEHVMASGALPPGFPPVRIDGDLYWDGGLYSNTPLETVLEDEPRADTLCFMVDLWSAKGPEPTTLDEVQTRQKDVMFASRSKRHIDNYLKLHQLRRTLHRMHEKLPAKLRDAQETQELAALGCDTTMHIVRLPYAGRDWHMASKDVNFSRGSIQWRWEQGYNDATRAIAHAGWTDFDRDDVGVVVHELLPKADEQRDKH